MITIDRDSYGNVLLKRKKSYRLGSHHTVNFVADMLTATESKTNAHRIYEMTTSCPSPTEKIHSFFIKDSLMAIIRQEGQGVKQLVLFVGEVTDTDNNPSSVTREHLNSMLAALAEFAGLPEIRIYWDHDMHLTMIGGVNPASPRGSFCADYCSRCVIDVVENSFDGFTLTFS